MLYFAFIYLFALTLFGHRFKKNTRLFLVFFPFLIIAVLRFGIGADYFSYEYLYHNLDPSSFAESYSRMGRLEILFVILSFLAAKIGLSYHVFVAILASALVYISLKWLLDNSPNFELSALLHYSILFFYWNISALRQGIVVTLLLYVYFNEKMELEDYKKHLISLVLVFMHPTAIIVPIMYFISKYNWNMKKFLILIAFIPLARMVLDFNILSVFSQFHYVRKVLGYTNQYDAIRLFSAPSLMRIGFFSFILFHYNELVEKFPQHKTMIKFSLLNLIIYFYMPTAMVVGTRTTIFGYYLILIIFPMVLELYRDRRLYKLVFLGLLGLSVLSYYNELGKLLDRTGYNYSISQLNFETIFQKNRMNFTNKYSFEYLLREENQEYLDNHDLINRVNSDKHQVENFEVGGLKQISVYFPAYNKYGIIDENGKITKLPYSDRRIDNGVIDFPDNSFLKMMRFKYEAEWLKSFESLNRFNFGDDTRVSVYKTSFLNQYGNLRITWKNHHFILMKDGEILVDRLYDDVHPFNHNGFALGYIGDYVEVINSQGQVIWIEPMELYLEEIEEVE